MTAWYFLIPISLFLGVIGLALFFWNIRNHQYDDMNGAANRILDDHDNPE